MGEAKKRGSFEQRVAQAAERRKLEAEALKAKRLEQERLERERRAALNEAERKREDRVRRVESARKVRSSLEIAAVAGLLAASAFNRK